MPRGKSPDAANGLTEPSRCSQSRCSPSTQLNKRQHNVRDAVVASLEEHEGYAEVGNSNLFRAFNTANIPAKVGRELRWVVLGIEKRSPSPVGMRKFAKLVVLLSEAVDVFFHAIDERENADGLRQDVRIGSPSRRISSAG